MLINALLKQAEEFGFMIYQARTKIETNCYIFPKLKDASDSSVEDNLFGNDNYAFWSEDYDESEEESSYSIVDRVEEREVEYTGLSEDKVLPTLEKMVLEELKYRYKQFENLVIDDSNFSGMSGLAVYLELNNVPEDKRNYPLYVYDYDCGDQFPIVGLDNSGFKVATEMGTNTAAYDESKLLTIDTTLSILDSLPVEVLNKPIKAIDLETKDTGLISSISLYDDNAEISETNQLAINVNMG